MATPGEPQARLRLPDPLGTTRMDAVVFRPSPLAALDAFAKAFLGLLPIVVLFVLAGSSAQAVGSDDPWWVILAQNAQAAGALLFAFVPMVRLLFTRYAIDGEGIRVRSQLLATSDQRVSWEKVTAIGHRRTLFDRILGIARVDIIAYGARGTTLHLVGLKDAKAVRDHAATAMRLRCSVQAIERGD